MRVVRVESAVRAVRVVRVMRVEMVWRVGAVVRTAKRSHLPYNITVLFYRDFQFTLDLSLLLYIISFYLAFHTAYLS